MRAEVTQPNFLVFRTAASLTLRPNQQTLIGCFVAPGEVPRLVLFVARARAIPFPPEEAAILFSSGQP
jgi:hypothetical protein